MTVATYIVGTCLVLVLIASITVMIRTAKCNARLEKDMDDIGKTIRERLGNISGKLGSLDETLTDITDED